LTGTDPGASGVFRVCVGNAVFAPRILVNGLRDAFGGQMVNGYDFQSGFATIRLALAGDGSGGTAYFIDANGATGSLTLTPYAYADNSIMICGGGEGNPPNHTEWDVDYVRWTNEGAYDFSTTIDTSPTPPIVWQRQYEAEILPDAAGAIRGPGVSGAFDLYTEGSPPAVSVSGGILDYATADSNRRSYSVGTVNDTTAGSATFDARNSPGTTIEFRMKVLNPNDLGNSGIIVPRMPSGGHYGLRLSTTAIRDAFYSDSDSGLNLSSDFFRIRLAIPGVGGAATAYYITSDNVTGSVTLGGYPLAPNNGFEFALGSGNPPLDAQWDIDYVRWTHAGAFSFATDIEPMPETAGTVVVIR